MTSVAGRRSPERTDLSLELDEARGDALCRNRPEAATPGFDQVDDGLENGAAAGESLGASLASVPKTAAMRGANKQGDGALGVTATTTRVLAHTAWQMNLVAPKNTADKRAGFQALSRQETKVAATARHQATETGIAKAETRLRAALAKQSPERKADIERLDLRAHAVDRNDYRVSVGGRVIELHDEVDSYATTDAKGLMSLPKSDQALVANAVAHSDFSEAVKHVLVATSRNEGSFTSINGYDRKNLSFGMIQMAGGGAGETLSRFLGDFKAQHPQGFADGLVRHGIDVESTKRGPELTVRAADGTVSRGAAAAKTIGTDPRLAAALSATGFDPAMQDEQLRFALGYLMQARQGDVKVGGQSVAISALLTSERGNGVLFDRAVNLGPSGARRQLESVAHGYLHRHPGASLADEEVRAAIERDYVVPPPKDRRTPAIVARTSGVRGSFAVSTT